MSHSEELFLGLSSSSWTALGVCVTAVGSVFTAMSAWATLKTVRTMESHELMGRKPELFFESTYVEVLGFGGRNGPLRYGWTEKNREMPTSLDATRLLLKVHNVGNGVAKDVDFNWRVDYLKLKYWLIDALGVDSSLYDFELVDKSGVYVGLRVFRKADGTVFYENCDVRGTLIYGCNVGLIKNGCSVDIKSSCGLSGWVLDFVTFWGSMVSFVPYVTELGFVCISVDFKDAFGYVCEGCFDVFYRFNGSLFDGEWHDAAFAVEVRKCMRSLSN